jgi:hypothetical protein
MRAQLIEEFTSRVERGDLADQDLSITYRVSGGMPSETHESIEGALIEEKQEELQEFNLSGDGRTEALIKTPPEDEPEQVVSGELDPSESQELFQLIKSGISSLTPRAEARFLPDSQIGALTINVGGEEETLYFLADEDARQTQGKPIAPEIAEALQNFEQMSQRLKGSR